MDFGYIFKVELVGFVDVFDEWCDNGEKVGMIIKFLVKYLE